MNDRDAEKLPGFFMFDGMFEKAKVKKQFQSYTAGH